MLSRTRLQILIALFFLFLLVFNFPFLSIIDQAELVLGIPRLYLGLFGSWLLFIGLIFLTSRLRGQSPPKG